MSEDTSHTSQEKETLRHAVLECLVGRAAVALAVPGIWRRVAKEVDFPIAPADVAEALLLLQGLGLAKVETDDFGSSEYWQATAAGVLHVERQ